MPTPTESSPAALRTIPDRQALRELAACEGPCVSLYLEPHAAGSGSVPSRLTLRALLPVFEETLEGRGVLPTDREALLAPLHKLVEEGTLGGGHSGGIAIFRSPRELAILQLPWAVSEEWSIEGRFALRRLCEWMRLRPVFYVLALARKHVRLLECSAGGVAPVPLPSGVPGNLEDFLALDTPDQVINRAPTGAQFATTDDQDSMYQHLHCFHKAVDTGLRPLLAHLDGPLVIAATTADAASFAKVNTYPKTVDTPVFASPDGGLSDAELAELARARVEVWVSPAETRAIEHYRNAPGKLISEETTQILEAAAQGRVLNLFVSIGAAVAIGDFDRIVGKPLLSGEFLSSADDLVNAAIVETLRHDGAVWPLPPEHMPVSCTMAAAFRY